MTTPAKDDEEVWHLIRLGAPHYTPESSIATPIYTPRSSLTPRTAHSDTGDMEEGFPDLRLNESDFPVGPKDAAQSMASTSTPVDHLSRSAGTQSRYREALPPPSLPRGVYKATREEWDGLQGGYFLSGEGMGGETELHVAGDRLLISQLGSNRPERHRRVQMSELQKYVSYHLKSPSLTIEQARRDNDDGGPWLCPTWLRARQRRSPIQIGSCTSRRQREPEYAPDRSSKKTWAFAIKGSLSPTISSKHFANAQRWTNPIPTTASSCFRSPVSATANNTGTV